MAGGILESIPENLILISEYDGRIDFTCDSEPLDEFVREQAREFSQRRLGETWLLCVDGEVVAFYTLAPASVPDSDYTGDEAPEFERLDDVRYPIPALLIARFGVATAYQGREIGRALIDYIIVWTEKQELPFWFIQVDSKVESVPFYRKLNFVTSGVEENEAGITSMYYPLAPRVDEHLADR